MAMSELKRRLLQIELAKIGLREARYNAESDFFAIDPLDSRMPRIYDNGDIHYGSEYSHLVRSDLYLIVGRVAEIIAAWERAAAVQIGSNENFRILARYNDIVLAARDDSEQGFSYGFQFVTWQYDYNRTGFEQGHYTTDYDDAKEDFALRCGLVDKHKLFDETEMKLIRQGLVHLGANFPDLTTEQMTLLGKVVERIEMLVPEIREHEELEHQGLVPDDELEI